MKKRVIIPMLVFAVVFSNVYASNNNHRSKRVKTVKTVNAAARKAVKSIKSAKVVNTPNEVNRDTIAPDSSSEIRGKLLIFYLDKAKPYKPEYGPAL